MGYRLCIIFLAFVIMSCRKGGEPTVKTPIPDSIDSIVGFYKGTLTWHKEDAYFVPPATVHTDKWDTTFSLEFTIVKTDSTHFMAVLPGFIDSLVFSCAKHEREFTIFGGRNSTYFTFSQLLDSINYYSSYDYGPGGGIHTSYNKHFAGAHRVVP